VWRWDQQEPFGVNVPNENPSGLGAFDLPLRLPDQYFDKETNLHYNYFRDYDPSLGRYGESDPIGLKAGLNTYAYVQSQPVSRVDPFGLVVLMLPPGISERGGNTVACNGAGGFQILLEDPGNDPCWVDCLRAHEQVHVNDFTRIDPNVCAGAASRQAISAMSNNLVWIFELRGYEEELRCLREKLKQTCTGGPCDPKVRERIRDVEGIIRDMRKTGRVPQ